MVAAAAATVEEVSKELRDHSSQHLRHQPKVNDRRHLNLLATNSRPHSKDTAAAAELNSR